MRRKCSCDLDWLTQGSIHCLLAASNSIGLFQSCTRRVGRVVLHLGIDARIPHSWHRIVVVLPCGLTDKLCDIKGLLGWLPNTKILVNLTVFEFKLKFIKKKIKKIHLGELFKA